MKQATKLQAMALDMARIYWSDPNAHWYRTEQRLQILDYLLDYLEIDPEHVVIKLPPKPDPTASD